MAIIVPFNGVSLRIPGAYTNTQVKQTGGLPFVETGIVGLIGEAAGGEPGSTAGIVEYDSSTLNDIISTFKSGPIVDGARALVNGSNDARIPNNVGRILIYKTNASTQATLTLATTWGTLTSKNYGAEENLISAKVDEDTAEAWTIEFGADWTTTPGNDLTLRVNGGTVVTLTSGNMTSAANTVTEINTKLNTALSSSATYASAVGDRISIDLMATSTGAPRAGMGIVLEFIADGQYIDIGVTVPQQGVALSAAENGTLSVTAANPTRSLTIARQSDGISETTDSTTGEVGGQVFMEIGCNAATSATLTITATQLTTTVAGGGASNLSLTLADYNTLNDLATYINTQTGYACSIPSDVNGALPPTVLDRVSAAGICASTTSLKSGKVKADSYSVKNWFDLNSQLVSLTETAFKGLPDTLTETFLSGGALGASTTSNFNAGFVAFEGKRVNTMIPLVSQDASDDLVEDANYTDSGSTYDVESIHTQLREHCKKMSNTKNKSERDGYAGYRGTFAECKTQAKTISSEFVSLAIQDTQVIGVDTELVWAQPHVLACQVAGMQAGSPIGTPITYKFIASNGLRHVKKQGATPSSTELFDPSLIGHKNQAIDNGIMPAEQPSSGGVRLVVQNTTYQADANFVLNRKHVLEVAHYVAYSLRVGLESTFIGEKARTGTAESIRNYVIATMTAYLRDELIVGDDTNDNLGFKNLSVNVTGNTAKIDVTITPVQSLDFALISLQLDNIRQSA